MPKMHGNTETHRFYVKDSIVLGKISLKIVKCTELRPLLHKTHFSLMSRDLNYVTRENLPCTYGVHR